MADKKKSTLEEVQSDFCAVLATLQEYGIVLDGRRISDVNGILLDVKNYAVRREKLDEKCRREIAVERMKVQVFAEELYKVRV